MRYCHKVYCVVLSSIIKMFIIWRKQEQFNSFNVTGFSWFVLTGILLANGDEPNLILLKFAHPLYFFSHRLFGTYRNKIGRLNRSMILDFSLRLFHFKTLPI